MNESPEDGWIDAAVVRNVFTATMRKIEETMPHSERFPVRQLVMELVESAKYAILKHRKQAREILKTVPIEVRPEATAPGQRDAHEKRLQGIKGRQG